MTPRRLGSPEWLRSVPARWGLRQAEACRVMGIAPSTYRAKCAGVLPISERLVGRIVDVELVLVSGNIPFGWPFGTKLPHSAGLQLSPRTVDHMKNIIAWQSQLRAQEIEAGVQN